MDSLCNVFTLLHVTYSGCFNACLVDKAVTRMNGLGLYPIPGSDEMPLTDIEVAVKDNYHVSTHSGHYLVQVYYPTTHTRRG